MTVYSSANWIYAIDNPRGAYMNYTPTLFDIANLFGKEVAEQWVATNVLAIWYVKPDNNPQIYDQAKAWARMWARMNKNYTIGELTLFFARCQAGKYFLGNRLDLTRIGNVFEEKFKSERASELNRYISERTNAEREQREKEDLANSVTYEEYKQMHSDFDQGGAIARLLGGDTSKVTHINQ